MKLEKYSFGMGDRFLHQGRAQLQAIINAKDAGVGITPVWNKSDREHVIVGREGLVDGPVAVVVLPVTALGLLAGRVCQVDQPVTNHHVHHRHRERRVAAGSDREVPVGFFGRCPA